MLQRAPASKQSCLSCPLRILLQPFDPKSKHLMQEDKGGRRKISSWHSWIVNRTGSHNLLLWLQLETNSDLDYFINQKSWGEAEPEANTVYFQKNPTDASKQSTSLSFSARFQDLFIYVHPAGFA